MKADQEYRVRKGAIVRIAGREWKSGETIRASELPTGSAEEFARSGILKAAPEPARAVEKEKASKAE